ncbi:conjugal transfer protein TraN [Burkholderia multivorans]|uniref:conjugal transfer protein TraN n=1 Tax=Burkholderia multivorans TaxID=87883 RepID=UPI00158C4E25|nr:conjugal transfer protein TraN [Burkholderia multivorans]MDN8102599.1 conjugal transfer protein TraN [Burkholderia multivorans]
MTSNYRPWLAVVGTLLALIMAPLAAVAQTYPAGACSLVPGSQTCVDTTPCKTDATGQQICLSTASLPSGALQVPYSCWQYAYNYACQGTTTDTCAQYRNDPSCGVVQSVCNDTIAETGKCDEWTYTYQCQTQPQQTAQQLNCTSGLFNDGGFPTPANGNNSFLTGALGLEMLGEAQTYTDGNSLFAGVAESCRKGYEGIQNCCKSTPGAQSNSAVMSAAIGAAGSVLKYAGEKLIDLASPYVFDAMYSNGIFTQALTENFTTAFSLNAANGGGTLGTNLAANGLSVGAFGFTVGFGTMGGGLFGANMQLASFGSDGYLAFNPYVFAAEVAIQIITQLMSCSQAEQMLALHKGAGLSTFINETCAKSVLGACIQYVDNYCSFNSVLAEIINIQGKTQLGLPLAGCGGLTPAQISSIDFTKIDFSAFTNQMMQQAEQNLPQNIKSDYTPIEQNSSSGTAQSSTNPVLPSYPTN